MQNEDELRQILSTLETQPPRMSLLQKIAEAVARGLGTAASPNPGGALLQQVGELTEERRRKQDREQSIRNLGVQFKLQDLANRLAEQREIAKEGRVEKATERAEERAETREENAFYRNLGGQIQLRNIDQRDKKELFNMDLAGRKEMQILDEKAARRLEELRSSNDIRERQKATEFDTIFKLTLSDAMTGEEAGNIIRKIKSDDPDDPITPKERKLLAKARKALENEETMSRIRVAVANNRGGAGEKFETQLLQGLLVGARTEDLGFFKDAQGQVKMLPITRGIGGIIQSPEGFTFVREATLTEKTRKAFDDFGQMMPVLQGKLGGAMDDGATTTLVNNFMAQVEQAKGKGTAMDVIIKGLQDDAARNPKFKDAIDIVIARMQTDTKQAEVDKAQSTRTDAEAKSKEAEKRAKETPQDFEKRVKKIKAEKQVSDLEKTEDRARKRLNNLKEGGTADPRIIKKAEEDLADASGRLQYARSQLAKMD